MAYWRSCYCPTAIYKMEKGFRSFSLSFLFIILDNLLYYIDKQVPMGCGNATDVMLLILAFFLPPLAVFFKRGCSADLLINILLTILGYLPGMVHAWYLIIKYPYQRRV